MSLVNSNDRLAEPGAKWLPVDVKFAASASRVRWRRFNENQISEPLFYRAVSKAASPHEEMYTELSPLFEAASRLPATELSGIIFHISRCGSTLLANVLRAASSCTVLSEARPICMFFRPDVFAHSVFPAEGHFEARKMFLDAMLRLYAHAGSSSTGKVVLKCYASHTLQVSFILRLFPGVPSVILVRNPEEIIVSNVRKPAGWVRARVRPKLARRMFGWQDLDPSKMATEEYCARGIGRFCECAHSVFRAGGCAVDYSQLTNETMYAIGRQFGLTLLSPDSERVRHALTRYSKSSPELGTEFASDVQKKRAAVSPQIRSACAAWALPAYNALLQSARAAGRLCV